MAYCLPILHVNLPIFPLITLAFSINNLYRAKFFSTLFVNRNSKQNKTANFVEHIGDTE